MLRSRIFVFALCAFALAIAPCLAQDTLQQEAAELASLLNWHSGSIVGEIGAGHGQLTVDAAERVGLSGKVYSNELDPDEFSHLQELAADHKNIVAIKAAEASTNFPPNCCDSIFMRLVYHHLTNPAAIDASLFQSLKPGGKLAVVDETPRPGSTIPPGVPKNREGHGIPQKILISELTAAGFRVVKIENTWPAADPYHSMYCVLFRKPAH
jgi:SAM-dependent methyltransferase